MLTRVLRTVRIDTIDNRSQVGVALRRLREELMDQIGGEGEVTPAQRILVEEAAKSRIIAAAVGEWILRQETLVRPDGDLLPAVVQQSALVANLARLLTALGLERRGKQAQSLGDYIETRNGAGAPPS
jgi:hypothetical protein